MATMDTPGRSGAVVGSLGELLVEFVCTERDGHNLVPGTYRGPFASGAPGIFIDQAARLGASAIFAGAVGDDAFGKVLLQRFATVGVSNTLIKVVPDLPTGSAFVSYNSDGTRDFVFNIAHSAASHFPVGAEAVDAMIDFGVTVFHISGSTLGDRRMRTAALEICRALHTRNVVISLDPNIRKELLGDPDYLDVVRELLALATYVLPSDEDVDVLFPGESFEAIAARLLAGSATYVVLKRGDKGCIGAAPNGVLVSLPAHAVEVADPTGAGDCFCATFVALMASGQFDFADALARANAAGALAVGQVGPMEGNSTLAAIERFLADAP